MSGVSNSSLQYCCNGSFFSILFASCAIKGPAKELRLSFMSGEKYVNKIFLLFSGSESATVPLRINLTWNAFANVIRTKLEREMKQQQNGFGTGAERIWNGGRTDMEQTSSL